MNSTHQSSPKSLRLVVESETKDLIYVKSGRNAVTSSLPTALWDNIKWDLFFLPCYGFNLEGLRIEVQQNDFSKNMRKKEERRGGGEKRKREEMQSLWTLQENDQLI